MPRFFVAAVEGDRAVITGEDALHLARALRVKAGETITVCDAAGVDHICQVESITPQEVTAVVTEAHPADSEPPVPITLYQALCKGDKFETIIQKAVELGACEIVPVLTHRCVSRPDAASLNKKEQRWQKIAQSAAKQSGRGLVPRIAATVDFPTAVAAMKAHGLSILFYENATVPLGRALQQPTESIAIMTGPEGGFEPSEVEHAVQNGVDICSLGPRILRCETAPLAALAILTATLEIL